MTKTLLTIFTLVFTVMFSSTSFAGWTKVGESLDGNTFYVDYERIRKHGGYTYWWTLLDFLKPSQGWLSLQNYHQGDCNLIRWKLLSSIHYEQPMGGGTGDVSKPIRENANWQYFAPNSVSEGVLKSVCNHIGE